MAAEYTKPAGGAKPGQDTGGYQTPGEEGAHALSEQQANGGFSSHSTDGKA